MGFSLEMAACVHEFLICNKKDEMLIRIGLAIMILLQDEILKLDGKFIFLTCWKQYTFTAQYKIVR